MKYLQILSISFIAILLSSCAGSYKSIAPQTMTYSNSSSTDKVDFSFRYGVLTERGNKKYAKKETKSNLKVVAIKITNNSDKDLVIEQDLNFYAGNAQVHLLQPEYIYSKLKQATATHLLYLLLTPLTFNRTNSNGEINSTPIGYVIGPGLAGGNMAVASSSNKKFKKELNSYFLNNKTIKAGETVHGLIGINSVSFEPLTLK